MANNKFWGSANANWATSNWGTADGGPYNTAAPATGDTVYFNANSTGTCTIAATPNTIAALIMTNNAGTLTVSGSRTITVTGATITLGGTITGATLTLTCTGTNPTITFNGSTPWPGPMTWNTTGGTTVTLKNGGATCKVTGLVTVTTATVLAADTTETLTCNGGLSLTAALSPGTNSPIVILGGGNLGGGSQISNEVHIAGDVTLTLSWVAAGNVTCVSGSLSGSSYYLDINANLTLNCVNGANSMTIPNLYLYSTHTLTSIPHHFLEPEPYKSVFIGRPLPIRLRSYAIRLLKKLPVLAVPFADPAALAQGVISGDAQARADRLIAAYLQCVSKLLDILPDSLADTSIAKLVAVVNSRPGLTKNELRHRVRIGSSPRHFTDALLVAVDTGQIRIENKKSPANGRDMFLCWPGGQSAGERLPSLPPLPERAAAPVPPAVSVHKEPVPQAESEQARPVSVVAGDIFADDPPTEPEPAFERSPGDNPNDY